jgi:hypothetical protein
MNTLFVVASTELLTTLKDVFTDGRRIETDQFAVVMLGDQGKTWKDVQAEMTREIAPSVDSALYVAVHNGCLGITNKENFQVECQEHTEQLKKAFSSNGNRAFGSISVWGFHHFPRSSIYCALKELRKWNDIPPEKRNEFKPGLLAAFRPQAAISFFDRLSVIKHQLVGQFTPLDLQLQLLREDLQSVRDGSTLPKKVHDRLNDIVERLDEKQQAACALLERAKELVKTRATQVELASGNFEEKLKEVDELLNGGFPPLPASSKDLRERFSVSGLGLGPDAEFHAWLRRLDDALRSLREVTIHE